MVRYFELMWYFLGTIAWVICIFFHASHGYNMRMWLSIVIAILSFIELVYTVSTMMGA